MVSALGGGDAEARSVPVTGGTAVPRAVWRVRSEHCDKGEEKSGIAEKYDAPEVSEIYGGISAKGQQNVICHSNALKHRIYIIHKEEEDYDMWTGGFADEKNMQKILSFSGIKIPLHFE